MYFTSSRSDIDTYKWIVSGNKVIVIVKILNDAGLMILVLLALQLVCYYDFLSAKFLSHWAQLNGFSVHGNHYYEGLDSLH